jgi:hypothetical protein
MNGDIIVGAAKQAHDWLDWATPVFTFLGVVVVAFYTYYAKKQRDAANEANSLSRDAQKAFQDATELGNRAWVMARLLLRPVIERAHALDQIVYCELSNCGRSPATNVRSRCILATRDEVPDEIDWTGEGSRLGLLPPNQGENLHTLDSRPTDIAQQLVTAVIGGRKVFFYACEVKYTDWFNKPRRTIMCWEYNVTLRKWMPAQKHNRME